MHVFHIGTHPHHADEINEEQIQKMSELIGEHKPQLHWGNWIRFF